MINFKLFFILITFLSLSLVSKSNDIGEKYQKEIPQKHIIINITTGTITFPEDMPEEEVCLNLLLYFNLFCNKPNSGTILKKG